MHAPANAAWMSGLLLCDSSMSNFAAETTQGNEIAQFISDTYLGERRAHLTRERKACSCAALEVVGRRLHRALCLHSLYVGHYQKRSVPS